MTLVHVRGRIRPPLVLSFEPRIRELLKSMPTMPATAIAERFGWPHSQRTLAELRPYYLPQDPASRTSH